jgi:hypothetical protein
MIISFLLKKIINQTPYSPISYFGKENKPCTFIIHYPNTKSLKTLITLSHLNIFNATPKN